MLWKYNSQENWLRDGVQRRAQNKVFSLFDENGIEHFVEGRKGNIVFEYFQKQFMFDLSAPDNMPCSLSLCSSLQNIRDCQHSYAFYWFHPWEFRVCLDLKENVGVSNNVQLTIPLLLWGIWKYRTEFLYAGKQADLNFPRRLRSWAIRGIE